jgi:AbrB family looped-hinge helix DNA binding protein
MPVARSRITAQGQVSVPAKIRHKLGVGPGSVLEWQEEGDRIVVHRSAQYSSEDIYRALFPKEPPKRRTLAELKEGIRERARQRYARR